MAAEFYHKTSALFEEFKKRELHSSNTDKWMKSNHNWTEYNVSTQDYIQKINKRERETEQAYRELMKNMDDLDKQTDQMSLKLEKLHALRNMAISSNNTTWPSVDDTFDRPLQSYYNRGFVHNPPVMPSNPTFNAMHSISTDYTLPKFSSFDESTQTEDAICANCQFPLTMYHGSNSSKSLTNNTDGGAPLMHKMYETLQNPADREIQFISPIPVNETKESHSVINRNLGFENLRQDISDSKVISSQVDFSPKENSSFEVPSLKFGNGTEIYSETDDKIDVKEKDYVDESIQENTGTVEQAVSKSDDESMNHEFDFLESDKRRSSVKTSDTQLKVQNFSNENNLKTENVEKDDSNDPAFQETTISSNKVNSTSADAPEFRKESIQDSATPYQFDSENMERIQISEDIKPDSSVSGGHPTPPFHSENASLASESDTFSEKDTPLTATAAYQALLNNVSATKTAQIRQQISDSDSEDEIENALATAVRKSSNVTFEMPGPILKTDARKESIAEIKPKTEIKAPISSTKPQTKLSKSTRKVLGFDTSSGSEVELAVKTNLNKTEDSDEFDFYD